MPKTEDWMPVFSVMHAVKTVHAAHPDVADPKRRERQTDSQDYWQRIGTAFTNPTGGFTIRLTAFPINGVLVVRPPEAHERMNPTMKG